MMKKTAIIMATLFMVVGLNGCATGASDKEKRKEEQVNKANRAQDELSRSTGSHE